MTQSQKYKMTNEEAAYVAGIVDGEGSIGLYLGGLRSVSSCPFYPRITVSNRNVELIEWLKCITKGGSICKTIQGKYQRPIFAITWASRQTVILLSQIKKYLIVKKDQAEVILDLDRLTEEAKKTAGGCFNIYNRLPTWLREKRLEARKRIVELNNRRIA